MAWSCRRARAIVVAALLITDVGAFSKDVAPDPRWLVEGSGNLGDDSAKFLDRRGSTAETCDTCVLSNFLFGKFGAAAKLRGGPESLLNKLYGNLYYFASDGCPQKTNIQHEFFKKSFAAFMQALNKIYSDGDDWNKEGWGSGADFFSTLKGVVNKVWQEFGGKIGVEVCGHQVKPEDLTVISDFILESLSTAMVTQPLFVPLMNEFKREVRDERTIPSWKKILSAGVKWVGSVNPCSVCKNSSVAWHGFQVAMDPEMGQLLVSEVASAAVAAAVTGAAADDDTTLEGNFLQDDVPLSRHVLEGEVLHF